nr:ribonuclease H-like domain-containing protein [Tanacetum cinerariifolium]
MALGIASVDMRVPEMCQASRSRGMCLDDIYLRVCACQYKARLVANGRSQQQGINCDETFSPVLKPATIRTVLSLAASRQWPIHQLDVNNAFLYGHLSKTVYMHQPPSRTDSSLFIFQQGNDFAYLLIHVYDIILTASSSDLLKHIISLLHAEFSMTDLDLLNYFLGISVQRTSSSLFLSQTKYACEVLEPAGMLNCNPCKTPADTESKLGPDGDPVSDPSSVGMFYLHDPREPHLAAMKHILRYVRETIDHGLQLYASPTSQLIAYSDADWAGCPTIQRAELEYRGVANVVAKTAWVKNLLRELLVPLRTATLVYYDNVSVVYLSCNSVQHQRTKHIEIDIHFVRDFVATGHVHVLHVSSRYQYADIFTKGLPSPLFTEFRSSLSVRPSPAPTAEAY